MMSHRPILVACLVLAIFATAAVGVAGGRVICVGEAGHVVVTSADASGNCQDCCEELSEAGSHGSDPATDRSDGDCQDWSLDAQNLERADGPPHKHDPVDGVFASIFIAGADPISITAECLCRQSGATPGGIPRAHLGHLQAIVLLI